MSSQHQLANFCSKDDAAREREGPDLAMSSHTADCMVQQLENSIKLAVLAPRTTDTVFLVTDGHRVHDALKTNVKETCQHGQHVSSKDRNLELHGAFVCPQLSADGKTMRFWS